MKKILSLVLVLTFVLAGCAPAPTAAPAPAATIVGGYAVNPGDILEMATRDHLRFQRAADDGGHRLLGLA